MSRRVSVFLTDDEHRTLESAAQFAGLKMPKAIKKMAFSNLENFNAWAELKPELEKLVYELGKQGVNLNQIAKKANQGYLISRDGDEALKKTSEIWARVLIFRTEVIKQLNKKTEPIERLEKVMSDDS